jgi:hypothetical protein
MGITRCVLSEAQTSKKVVRLTGLDRSAQIGAPELARLPGGEALKGSVCSSVGHVSARKRRRSSLICFDGVKETLSVRYLSG